MSKMILQKYVSRNQKIGPRAAADIGEQAARDGKSESDCPYAVGDCSPFVQARRRYWLEGYRSERGA